MEVSESKLGQDQVIMQAHNVVRNAAKPDMVREFTDALMVLISKWNDEGRTPIEAAASMFVGMGTVLHECAEMDRDTFVGLAAHAWDVAMIRNSN